MGVTAGQGGGRHIALVSDWFAPRRGGIESHLLGLGRALVAAGQRVTVLTAQPGARDDHAPLRLHPLPLRHLPGVDLAWPVGLVDCFAGGLAAVRPDLVHVHASIVAPACWAAIRAARRLDLPVVVTFHSDLRAFGPSLPLLAQAAGPAALTAVSTRIAAQLGARAWGGAAGAVLPNGFDHGFWSAPSRMDRSTGPFTIASALRLHRKKRPLLLARIARAVATATNRPVRLVIAGQGAARYHRALQGVADLPGWLPREGLRDLYHTADLFIQPARHESFGLSALEARAAGLPVIGRDDTGLAEFISTGRDGLLCPSDDAMMQAAIRLAQDAPLRAALSGPRPDLARLDWPQVAARHLALYDAVAAARSAGSISRTSLGR